MSGPAGPRPESRVARLAAPALATAFFLGASVHAGALGTPAEEILPHQLQCPKVVDGAWQPGEPLRLLVPWRDEDRGPAPGLTISRAWPTLSYVTVGDRGIRCAPILTEAWQAAWLSYPARLLAPVLGGADTLAGLRRVGALIGALGLLLICAIAARLGDARAGRLAALLLGSSVGWVFLHRTAYLIESGPPLFAALALWLVLGGQGRSGRLVAAGLCAGLAASLKITALWELAGMALFLRWAGRWPKARPAVWVLAALAALPPLVPFAILWGNGGAPSVIERKLSLLAAPLAALARVPRVGRVALDFLVDPMALLGPLLAGHAAPRPATVAALAALAPLILAAVRIRKRPGDADPERLLLAVSACVLVPAGLFYDDAWPVQVAFLLLPWYALGVARALLLMADSPSLRKVPAPARRGVSAFAIAAIVLAQGLGIARFARACVGVANPMLDGAAQRELAAALDGMGAAGTRPLTVTYNAVGVIEALTDGRVAPIHLYRLLAPRPGEDSAAVRERSGRAIAAALSRWPGPVVLPVGINLFEGLRQDPALARAALLARPGVTRIGAFPSGRAPVIELWR